MLDGNDEVHESYGMAGFTRVTCGAGGMNLFGSSIRHGTLICLKVKTAVRRRELSRDWIRGRDSLVEVYLSPNQFAEMLTSMNVGDGVPCTIRYADGRMMDECPSVEKRELFEKEFAAGCAKAAEKAEQVLADVRTVFGKASVNKADRAAIVQKLANLVTQIKSNLPFVQSQFNTAMDKTVVEAKAEVEAFVEGKVRSLGLDALESEVAKSLAAVAQSPALLLPEPQKGRNP